MTLNAALHWTPPQNEPVRPYRPGEPETKSLKAAYDRIMSETVEIPVIVNGEEHFTGDVHEIRAPHDHSRLLARMHKATPELVQQAIAGATAAWGDWSRTDPHNRLAVFLKAAEAITGPRRDLMNASTMAGQSKTCYQAEIEAACELADFLRFGAHFAMSEIYANQPLSPPGVWDYMDWRPLEGFVLAICPFNFTAISVNLPCAPAMMGNVALWKPTESATLSSYYAFRILQEAGLPPGVIQFLPGHGPTVGEAALAHRDLAGLHFTGSTATFQSLWGTIGANIAKYKSYPRIVGETGGKDFIVAHASADVDALVANTIRGAFEYQGQKCSAASRMYVSRSIWPAFRDKLIAQMQTVKMGDPGDFTNFLCAVIDERAFEKITGYIDYAKNTAGAEILVGGGYDRSIGWFVEPTVIQCSDPTFKTMQEEIFGPVLSLFVYDDDKFDETLDLVDTTSPYALTGAIFSQDRYVVDKVRQRLRFAAGNFYINDKPTGAIVNNQPFGGSRGSGTNDKAGIGLNLYRWVSARAIKETFVPATDYRYPFMG